MITDMELTPADDARKEIAAILAHIDQFIQGRDNGMNQVAIEDVRTYLKSIVKFRADIHVMYTFKDRYELELELGFVNVSCKIRRY